MSEVTTSAPRIAVRGIVFSFVPEPCCGTTNDGTTGVYTSHTLGSYLPHHPCGSRILALMPVDVEARVISNTRLSPDYNVIALAAPEIAVATSPGQFVMVKPGRGGSTPLLRRPFSVFEILRSDGQVVGLTLLSKRIGTTRCCSTQSRATSSHAWDLLAALSAQCILHPKPGWWPAASARAVCHVN